MRARVKKLLAAGVVSAMTCMVKTESPVLTSSCRELLQVSLPPAVSLPAADETTEGAFAGAVGSWSQRGHPPGSPPLLLPGVEGLPARAAARPPSPALSPQGLPGFGGRGRGPWHCGCSGRGQGKLAQTPSGWAVKHDSVAATAELGVGWGQRSVISSQQECLPDA